MSIVAFYNPYPPFVVGAAQVKTHHRRFVLVWAGSINRKHLYKYSQMINNYSIILNLNIVESFYKSSSSKFGFKPQLKLIVTIDKAEKP